MGIDGVNSAMTPLQFARVRSATRAIETSAPTTGNGGSGRHVFLNGSPGGLARSTSDRLIMPPTFHWAYRPAIINGKRAAKRTPQFNDSAFWSRSLNSLA